jgi:hypothetical protein
MSKPKNREVHFQGRRQSQRSVVEESKAESANEIPRASKQEIRHLIENEGATSTTRIAEKLNEDRFPTASAEQWTAQLVDSALRAQDMNDLKERLKENRGDEETPAGASLLEIKQAVDDTVRAALSDYGKDALKVAPALVKVDTFALKGAVADATGTVFKGFRKQMEDANSDFATEITSKVHTSVAHLLRESDLAGLQRVTNATGKNVAEVRKKIDDTCADLHDAVVVTLKDHSKAVIDSCENMALQISEDMEKRVDARFDALEDALVKKFTAGMDIDLDEALGRVVDARLKLHLYEATNRFAVMVEKLRATLAGDKVRKVR